MSADRDRAGKHYVILGRASAHKQDDLREALKDHPEYEVVVDRRLKERRRGGPVMGSDNRTGRDRRRA